MNDGFVESRKAVMQAREALRNGFIKEARQWAEHAARLAPQSEDPWLILAAIAGPAESMDYIRKALEVNPDSPRAKQGMQWAMQRLGDVRGEGVDSMRQGRPYSGIRNDLQNSVGESNRSQGRPPQPQFGAGFASGGPQPPPGENRRKSRKRGFLFPVFLIVMGCAVFMFAAWSAVTSPALASILNMSSAQGTQSAPLQSFAQVNIPKPTFTPQPIMKPAVITSQETLAATPFPSPATEESTAAVAQNDLPMPEFLADPADIPIIAPTESPPAASETPGVAYAEIIADTPTSEYIAPTAAPYAAPQAAGYDGEHWIDVDLSQQRVYAYAGDTLVNSFIVSTGTWQTPTVTGKYKVWIKLRSTDMSGPGYYLPDVPYVMYFYKGYGLHGTYWHNNFGTPMSHGCVNLTIPDAEWLYNFSRVGTVVNVHY